MPCNQLNDYIRACGVICPDGTHLQGKGGCTVCRTRFVRTMSPITFRENLFNQQCASTTVTVRWAVLRLESDVIRYRPTACCPEVCATEIAEVEAQLEAHEAEHRANYETAIAQANADWMGRRFGACGGTGSLARRMLLDQISAAQRKTLGALVDACEMEPPQPRDIDCAKCLPARPGQGCVNGTCQETVCPDSSRCPQVVDCSRRGRRCLCLRTTEGDIRCGGPIVCATATFCITNSDSEVRFGLGWFCEEPGTGCCGCERDRRTGEVNCFPGLQEAGRCVPPC